MSQLTEVNAVAGHALCRLPAYLPVLCGACRPRPSSSRLAIQTITITTNATTTTTTMTRHPTSLLLLLLSLLALSTASTSPPPPTPSPNTPKLTSPPKAIPTFCKCTCFTNSTIIELGPASDNHPSLRHRSPPSPAYQNEKRAASASCDQCNRDFCLQKYNLPICRDAEDKDVSTQCFQRDSVKDRVIVWGFIVGTAGLLGWAGVRGVLEGRVKQQQGGGSGLGGR